MCVKLRAGESKQIKSKKKYKLSPVRPSSPEDTQWEPPVPWNPAPAAPALRLSPPSQPDGQWTPLACCLLAARVLSPSPGHRYCQLLHALSSALKANLARVGEADPSRTLTSQLGLWLPPQCFTGSQRPSLFFNFSRSKHPGSLIQFLHQTDKAKQFKDAQNRDEQEPARCKTVCSRGFW